MSGALQRVARRALAGALLLAALGGLAAAVEYRVDSAGGPLTLPDLVAAAFAAWEGEGGAELEPSTESEEADTLFAYGDAARFGPDTVSLTLRTRGPDGDSAVEVRLDPSEQARLPRALLHETGVLLGVGTADTGVMAAAIADGDPEAPTEDDLAALRAAREFPREDLNRDGVVDFYDLAVFGESYGAVGVSLPADLDGDGTVDETDLAVLREAYTFSPPSETPPADLAPPEEEESLDADLELPPGFGVEDEPVEDGPVEDGPAGEGGSEEEAPAPPDEEGGSAETPDGGSPGGSDDETPDETPEGGGR